MTLARRAGALGLAAAAVALVGCASLSGIRNGSGDLGREVRAGAPADYDVLVAQQHLSEGDVEAALLAYERAVAKDPESAYLHRTVADSLARVQRFDEAVAHAERAHELDPEDVSTRTLLAQLYRIQQKPDAAVAVLLDESGEPFDADAAFLVYQIYLEQGQLDEGLAIAEWMVENDPDPLRAYVALANAYQKMARPIDAEQALRDALVAEPGNLRIYGALARSMRERGDREGEIEVYREVLALNPDDHSTLVALAEAQTEGDDTEGAIATYEEIARRYPDDTRTIVHLAFLLLEERRFAEAAERFEVVLEQSPDEHEIRFFLGIARRRTNEDDAALTAFSEIPPGHKHYAEARTQMAAIYERRGDYEAALAEIQLALDVEPSRSLELYTATLRSKAGDFDGAVAYLEKLLEEDPSDDELLYNLGVVYGEGDRPEEALEYMERALVENPENASALNYIGYTWAERGEKLDEAEELITRAIELRPDDGYIVDSLGWVFYMRARPLVESGRRAQAKPYLERALKELYRADELTGGDPVISEHIGDTYLLLQRRRKALARFEEAVNLGPRDDEQPELKDKLEALRRELE